MTTHLELQYFDMGNSSQGTVTILVSLQYTEIALILIHFVAYTVVLYVTWHTTYHFNLRVILFNLIAKYYVALAARAVIISYQLEWISSNGDPDIIILVASFLRTYYFAYYMLMMVGICFERYLATWRMGNYERKRRPYIGISITVLMNANAAWGSLLFLFALFPPIVLVGTAVCGNVCSALFLNMLYWNNRRRQREMAQDYRTSKEEYSLSLRFQLDENLRSILLIRNGFLLCCIVNVLLGPIYVLSRTESIQFLTTDCRRIMETVFNLGVAMVASIVPLAALYTNDFYMTFVRGIPIIGFMADIGRAKVSQVILVRRDVVQDETSLYFDRLFNQWNADPHLSVPTNRYI